MFRSVLLVLAALATTSFTSAQEPASDLDLVLDRYVEAVGGRAALEALDAREIHGLVIHDLRSRRPPVYDVDTLAVFAEAGGRHATLVRTAKGEFVSGWTGETRWWHDPADDLRTEDLSHGDRNTWWRDPQGPLHLRETFPGLSYEGVRELEGRPMHVARTAEGDELFFDADSGLLVRLGFNRTLADYRSVDGVLVPHRISISRKGGSTDHVVGSVTHGAGVRAEIERREGAAGVR